MYLRRYRAQLTDATANGGDIGQTVPALLLPSLIFADLPAWLRFSDAHSWQIAEVQTELSRHVEAHSQSPINR